MTPPTSGARCSASTGVGRRSKSSSLTSAERAFNVLNMRSADLTAVARIRDAAIEQFGEHGFGVGLRTLAEAAGVSAALVIHHFGSKDGLQKACDEYVAEEIRSEKSATIQSNDPATW